MTTSLKAIVSELAPVLGLTAAALYERQRFLVRRGLLEKPKGRGPGQGTTLTLEAASMLIAAVIVSRHQDADDDAEVIHVSDMVAATIRAGSSYTYRRRGLVNGGLSVTVTLPPPAILKIAKIVGGDNS